MSNTKKFDNSIYISTENKVDSNIILLRNMTSTEATALTGVANGYSIYVSDTGGVFTNPGFWVYEEGAWTQITSGGYSTILENDTSVTSRSSINFITNGTTTIVADDSGSDETEIDIKFEALTDIDPTGKQDGDLWSYNSTTTKTEPVATAIFDDILHSIEANISTDGVLSTFLPANYSITGIRINGDSTTTDTIKIGTSSGAEDISSTLISSTFDSPVILKNRWFHSTNDTDIYLSGITTGSVTLYFLLEKGANNKPGDIFDTTNYYTSSQTNANFLSANTSISGASLTDTQIGFGDASDNLTGSTAFTYDYTNNRVSIGDNSSPRVAIDMSGKTDAIFLPNGTESQRPPTGSTPISHEGYIRYNSDSRKFEGFEDLVWKNFITTNAAMSFIPNYYVYDETEFLDAFVDIAAHNYGGGNIYIAGPVILTANRTLDFTGINIYNGSGYISFNTSNTDPYNTNTKRIIITAGRPSFNEITFSGSGGNSSNDFSIYHSRTIFEYVGTGGSGTDYYVPTPSLHFNNCNFADIVGQSSGSTLLPIILFSGNIIGYTGISVYMNGCSFTSHKASAGSGAIDYKGFNIQYTGSILSNAHPLRFSNTNFIINEVAINNSGNLFGIIGNFNESPIYYSDESSYINNDTFDSTNDLERISSFSLMKSETTMLDDDYIFFNDSSGANGVNDNMKKITKSNFQINGTNVNVNPDQSIQFASGTTQTGSTELYYDYTNKNLNLGDSISNTGLYNIVAGSGITLTDDYSYGFGSNLISESKNTFIVGENVFIDVNSTYAFNLSFSTTTTGIEYGLASSIFGGVDNSISYSKYATIVGGSYNNLSGSSISENSNYSGIVAGTYNSIIGNHVEDSTACFIGAGSGNTITHGLFSGIVAGKNNIINVGSKGVGHGFIGGGNRNELYSIYSGIISGNLNIINKTGDHSSIIGGRSNEIGLSSGSANNYNNIIVSDYCEIGEFTFASIISCDHVNAIRSNLVHIPDLYIDNLSGTEANLIIGSDGIVITGNTGFITSLSLSGLSDVTIDSPHPTDGDYLIYDDSVNQWVASGITGDELSAGTGIIITDTTPGYVIISVDSSEVIPSLTDTYVAYGNASDQITGSTALTFDYNTTILTTPYLTTNSTQYNTSFTFPGTTPDSGTTLWNTDCLTLSTVLGNGIVGNHFEHSFIHIQNNTGSVLEKGKVVSYAGSIGTSGKMRGEYFLSSSSVTSLYVLGIVSEDIGDAEEGKLTSNGMIKGIQTNGVNYSESWTEGDILYASTGDTGGLTNIKPSTPIPAIPLAVVTASHATTGSIFVRPTDVFSLTDLTNVNNTLPTTTGQIMTWNNSSNLFEFTDNINNYYSGATNVVLGSISDNQIAYGNGTSITSSSELTWDDTNLIVSGSSSESVVISSTGSYYIGAENTDGSWRFKISDGDLIIEKRVSGTWSIGQTISV